MSKSSEAVKRWRQRTKERLVDAMGGKCVCCGYSKCIDALDFHHKDPAQKDVGLAVMRGNIVAWSKLVVEARKCVLVCNRCHREIHSGVTEVPKDASGFDEAYADYRAKEHEPCPICGKPKSPHQVTCSRSCGAARSWSVEWDKVNLKEMLRSKKIPEIADELKVSRHTVRKRAKKLGLIK